MSVHSAYYKGRWNDGRGDDSCAEVQRRGGGEHAAGTNF